MSNTNDLRSTYKMLACDPPHGQSIVYYPRTGDIMYIYVYLAGVLPPVLGALDNIFYGSPCEFVLKESKTEPDRTPEQVVRSGEI